MFTEIFDSIPDPHKAAVVEWERSKSSLTGSTAKTMMLRVILIQKSVYFTVGDVLRALTLSLPHCLTLLEPWVSLLSTTWTRATTWGDSDAEAAHDSEGSRCCGSDSDALYALSNNNQGVSGLRGQRGQRHEEEWGVELVLQFGHNRSLYPLLRTSCKAWGFIIY